MARAVRGRVPFSHLLYQETVFQLPWCDFACRYSNPPLHGALLVATILHDADLKEQWYKVGTIYRLNRGIAEQDHRSTRAVHKIQIL